MPHLLLARLHAIPELLVDDPQLRHLGDLPLLARVRPGDALAGLRVLLVGAPVPLEPADIEGIVEDAGAALDLAADGGVAPGAAAGPGDMLRVEALGDGARRRGRRRTR